MKKSPLLNNAEIDRGILAIVRDPEIFTGVLLKSCSTEKIKSDKNPSFINC